MDWQRNKSLTAFGEAGGGYYEGSEEGMIVVQILILGIILLIIPTVVGGLFANVDKGTAKLPFMWISGQILLWAGFQCICVPLILLEKSFSMVSQLFWIYMGLLVLLSLLLYFVRKGKGTASFRVINAAEQGKTYLFLWLLFGVLLVLQLVLAGCMAYEEGDDAFYVAISTITENADTMYRKLPYTGGTTGLDARHGLAPFPIWVSFLAKASGIPSVTMAHVVLPMILIIMSYGIYYLLGRHLLGSHKAGLPLFMILVELLILFGGYSVYSAENFLLVRTAQGKAVLANIIIPFLMLLMVLLLEKQEKQERAGVGYWFLLALAMTAGCLCSTLGTLLTCILVGVTGLCAAVCYRRWRVLVPTALCCMIPVLLALLYFVLD